MCRPLHSVGVFEFAMSFVCTTRQLSAGDMACYSGYGRQLSQNILVKLSDPYKICL